MLWNYTLALSAVLEKLRYEDGDAEYLWLHADAAAVGQAVCGRAIAWFGTRYTPCRLGGVRSDARAISVACVEFVENGYARGPDPRATYSQTDSVSS